MIQIGFIGIGNMGYAMLNGAVRVWEKSELTYTDVSLNRMQYVQEQTGISFTKDSRTLVHNCRFLVLAIKPQYLSGVIDEIRDLLTKDNILVSILPGISIAFLKKEFGDKSRIVRAMPNTPAMVGEGMTAISFSEDIFSEQEKKMVFDFFSSFGAYEVLEERLMNAAVVASGSSPAYVYLFMEALADSAVKYGIPRDKAYRMAAQTVLGSAKMLLETKEHPGALKDQVCSPGGTTIAGVAALEEYGFRNAVIKAADKCYEKTVAFGKD